MNLKQLAKKLRAKQDRINSLAFDKTPGVRATRMRMVEGSQWMQREALGEFRTGNGKDCRKPT